MGGGDGMDENGGLLIEETILTWIFLPFCPTQITLTTHGSAEQFTLLCVCVCAHVCAQTEVGL